MVRDAPEPSQKEFRRVVQDEQLGIPVENSLEVVYERMRCDDVIYVGLIATLQRDTGGSTAEVLDRVVETMRERGKLRRLVRTLTAQGRLGGWIVTALPIAMIVFLTTFKPGYLAPMTERTIGWVILIFAGMMVVLGAYCIRRIVDIKV
jgi:tight adherence protein B